MFKYVLRSMEKIKIEIEQRIQNELSRQRILK